MGILRFVLSVFVLLSHTGVTIGGYNIGVLAVISFYLLSGYSVKVLLDKYYNKITYLKYFYLDRFLSLLPQLYFFIIATMIIFFCKGINPDVQGDYLSNVTLGNIILNFLVFPLNLYMYLGVGHCMLVPQAWAMGLFISFYLVFPFIYYLSRILNKEFEIYVCFIALSLAVFLQAHIGILNNDYFGYRLLPGTLFIFLIGAMLNYIAKGNTATDLPKKIIYVVWLLSFILLVLNKNMTKEINMTDTVLLGLIIGIPIIYLVSNIRYSYIDNFFGKISYGVYLNHYFIIWTRNVIPQSISGKIKLIVASIFLSCLTTFIIEIPMKKLRDKVRVKLLVQ